jgi:hypothetical protein
MSFYNLRAGQFPALFLITNKILLLTRYCSGLGDLIYLNFGGESSDEELHSH